MFYLILARFSNMPILILPGLCGDYGWSTGAGWNIYDLICLFYV